MKNTREFLKRFLVNTDKTGRFVVKSKESGKIYFVETIYEGEPTQWGDVDPATKKMTGSYGTKYPGAVTEKESMITKENGFDTITYVHQGSPFGEIDRRDKEYLKSIGK